MATYEFDVDEVVYDPKRDVLVVLRKDGNWTLYDKDSVKKIPDRFALGVKIAELREDIQALNRMIERYE